MIHTSKIALINEASGHQFKNTYVYYVLKYKCKCYAYDFIVITCVKKLTTLKIAKRVASASIFFGYNFHNRQCSQLIYKHLPGQIMTF